MPNPSATSHSSSTCLVEAPAAILSGIGGVDEEVDLAGARRSLDALGAVDEVARARLHVAVVAKHFALEVEGALAEPERLLDRVKHLHAAGMATEAVDVGSADAELRAHSIHCFGELGLDERRDGAIEDDGESRVLDIPAHELKRASGYKESFICRS